MPAYSGIALEHHRISIFRNFFERQRIGCSFCSELHIFLCAVRSKNLFYPFQVLWYIHMGERRRFTENTQHCKCSFPCHRKECGSVLSGVQHSKQQIDFLTLLIHLFNGIRRNIQRITGKSADRKCFTLIYDRILPKVQCHHFSIHAYPPVLFFHFLIISCKCEEIYVLR